VFHAFFISPENELLQKLLDAKFKRHLFIND